MINRGLEKVDAVELAFGREVAPRPGAHVDDRLTLGLGEGREPAGGANRQGLGPLRRFQIEPARFQRMVVPISLDVGPGVIRVLNHRQTFFTRLTRQMIQRDRRIGGQVVKDRRQSRVEQRQIVLHPRATTAGGDSVVKWVAPRRAKRLQIARPEPADALLVEQSLADRFERNFLQLLRRALGLGIEGSDRFQGIPEQVQADRLIGTGRKDVDHAPPDRKLTLFRNGRCATIAVDRKVGFEVGNLDDVAAAGRIAGSLDDIHRRDPLDHRRNGRDQQPGFGIQAFHQPRQRRHPLGRHTGRRADPVIGQTIPRRQRQDLYALAEKLERVDKRRQPPSITRHKHRQAASRPHHVGQHQGVEALGRADEVQAARIIGDAAELDLTGGPVPVSHCRWPCGQYRDTP